MMDSNVEVTKAEQYLPEGHGKILLQIELPGLPPSVNHTYNCTKSGIYYKNNVAKEWQQSVSSIMRLKKINYEPCTEHVGFYIAMYLPDNRRRDSDNRIKAAQDCLTTANVIKDDSQIWDLRVIKITGQELKTELILFII